VKDVWRRIEFFGTEICYTERTAIARSILKSYQRGARKKDRLVELSDKHRTLVRLKDATGKCLPNGPGCMTHHVDPVKARSGVPTRRPSTRLTDESHHSLYRQHNYNSTMESPHPDERPLKKRRFFAENSSPAQVRTKQPSPPPQTPPPQVDSSEEAQTADNGSNDAPSMDGFDVGMLQAVVGDLSVTTLQRLKDVSGNNVERGRRNPPASKKSCSKVSQRSICI
jgi:hypothetical protein